MKINFNEELCSLCMNCMEACAQNNGDPPRLKIEETAAGIKRYQCCQCEKPACAYACTYELIYRNRATGAIEVEIEECQACHPCVRACPFQAAFIHPETGVACICDLCKGNPKCVENCPTGALSLQPEPKEDAK